MTALSSALTQKKCSVCQQPLSALQQTPYFKAPAKNHGLPKPVINIAEQDLYSCGNFECNNILDKKTQMSSPQFTAYFDFQRKSIQKNREDTIRNEKLRQKKLEDNRYENQLLYTETIRSKKLDPQAFPLLSLPSCWREETTVPDERIKSFSDNLNKLLDEISQPGFEVSAEDVEQTQKSEAASKSIDSNQQLEKLVVASCTLCQGGCCTKGGNHAYLSAGLLHNKLNQDNNLTRQAIFEQYVGRIPAHSIEKSCLFHTHSGCNLPREMRSSICNGYLCDGLKKFSKQENLKNQDNGLNKIEGVIAIMHQQDNWESKESLEGNPANYVGLIEVKPTDS